MLWLAAEGIVAGESGAAGLAGLLSADGELRAAAVLDATSRVLVIGSEGDTDPYVYRQTVGGTAEDVRGVRASV